MLPSGINKTLIILTVLTISKSLLAAEWSGQFGLELRIFNDIPAYPEQLGNSSSMYFQPEFYHEFEKSNSSITFVPYVRLDSNDSERTYADIRELTWVSVFDSVEWRLGIRKVFWGVTESQHLVDIINQTDLVASFDGEEKLGQPMINLSYITDLGSFDAFVLPYFRERTFAGVKGRLRSQPYVDTDSPIYESKNKNENVDYAFRWAHSIEEWDIGLSYFNGTSRDPRFVVGKNSVGATVLQPYYDLIEQTGLDIQATYDSWLWKLEAIYRSGVGGSLDDSYNAATGGIEYTFYSVIGDATDIGVVAEYLYDSRGELATTPFQKDIMLGIRFNLNDEQSTEALIGVIMDETSDAIVYSLEASRRLSNNVKASIEARVFSSIPSSDLFFYYSRDDYLQIDLTYFF